MTSRASVLVIAIVLLLTVVMPVSAYSLADDMAKAKPGDTIIVPKGTYTEYDIVIDKPVTVIGDDAIIDANHKGGAFVIRADGVTLEGFTIINTATAKQFALNPAPKLDDRGEPIPVDEKSLTYGVPRGAIRVFGDYTILRDITITGGQIGIQAYAAQSGLIDECIITDTEHAGILLEYGADGWGIHNSEITGCADGIRIQGSYSIPATGAHVTDTVITDSARNGVSVMGYAPENEIRRVTVTNNGDLAVYVGKDTPGAVIRDNVFETSASKSFGANGDVHVAVPKTGDFNIGSNNMRDAPGGPIKGIFEFFGWGVIRYEV